MNKRIVTVLAALSVCLVAATAHAQYGGRHHGGGYDRNAPNDFRAGGLIDDKVNITIRGDRVFYRTLSGDTPRDAELRLKRPLPRRNINVSVDKREGRGNVYVVQQPRRENDYTAVIRVNDPQGGAGRYNITANW